MIEISRSVALGEACETLSMRWCDEAPTADQLAEGFRALIHAPLWPPAPADDDVSRETEIAPVAAPEARKRNPFLPEDWAMQ